MKDFCKWLGVNEKIAKIAVWLFIFMAFLTMVNAMLESIGFPYYRLTVENLSRIDYPKAIEFIFACLLTLLSFYVVIFMVFKVNNFKKIFKYSILYLMLNIVFSLFLNDAIVNCLIIIVILVFCYFYSNKKLKYVLFGLISYIISVSLQYVCYLYKIRFIDYTTIDYLNKFLISLDYFIIMSVIILIKEIIIKKRGEK